MHVRRMSNLNLSLTLVDVKLVFLVVYKGVNCSNWDGAIKQWGKITTGIVH